MCSPIRTTSINRSELHAHRELVYFHEINEPNGKVYKILPRTFFPFALSTRAEIQIKVLVLFILSVITNKLPTAVKRMFIMFCRLYIHV